MFVCILSQFLYYRDQIYQGHHFCATLFDCYKVALSYGLRVGDGVSDTFYQTVETRWYLDVSYYFIVNVGMLNLVAGVIITTFGQLRENQARIKEDTEEKCFICGIDRQVFDRASVEPEGFKTHTKVDHNMWNYLYFIFLLWEQDKDDDDGLEQYVRRAIEANEISWFPLNKAIRLDQAASAEEALMHDLKKNIGKSEAGIATKLEKFQTNINVVLEQLNQILKQDHIEDRVEASRQAFRKSRRPSMNSDTFSASKGDMRAVTAPTMLTLQRENSWRQGKVLVLEMIEITGFTLPKSSFNRIFCNVIVDSTFQQVSCDEFEHNRITFKGEKKFKLVENVFAQDERTVVVQLMKEVNNPYSLTEVESIKIPVDDLLLAEGCVLEVFFNVGGQGPMCKLSVLPTCVSSAFL
jgi:hypothetical protein